MNKILTMLLTLVLVTFFATSTLAGGIKLPAKYDLGKQLEEVNKVWKTRILSWEDVDNQSLIIETSPGHFYLLVLTVPAHNLPMVMNRIRITNSGSAIREGLDNVIVSDGAHILDKYPIERIYKIDGREKMTAIVKQLQGEKGETHVY